MLAPAFTFMSVFGTADFRVGRPAIKFLILCAENHFHRLTGFKVLRSCGAEFHAVGQMYFHSDLRQGFIGGVLHGANECFVLGTVFQEESGSPPNYVIGFVQSQEVAGCLFTPFDNTGMFMAHTLGTVLAVGVFANHAATECQRPQQDCHHQSG